MADATTLDVVRAVIESIGATASLAAAVVAFLAIRSWRDQMFGQRKHEVAEQTLRLFYQARRAIERIRSAFWHVEGMEWAKSMAPDMSEDQLRRAETPLLTMKRLHEHRDLFIEMEVQEAICLSVFGQDAGKPFETLFDAVRTVRAASDTLIQMARQYDARDDQSDKEFTREMQNHLWATGTKDDTVANKVAQAIAQTERMCAPHLGRGRGTKDGYWPSWLRWWR